MKFLTPITRCFLWMLVAAFTLFAVGCDSTALPEEDPAAGVYVANAGLFGGGNSSYTVYDPQSEQAEQVDLAALQSYAQSLLVADSLVYVLMGETSAIEVFSTATNRRVGRIEGIPNPRYMALVGASKAYVTSQDYTGNPARVAVIDLSSNTVTKTIEVGGSPEGVAVVDERAYVALGGFGGSGELAVLDATTDEAIGTVDAECDGARSLVVDEQGEVIVFCTGATQYDADFNVTGTTDGAIRVLDGATGVLLERLDLDAQITSASLGQDAFYAPEAEEAYATLSDSTVLRFNTATNTADVRIGPLEGNPIGAIGYDAAAERLYLGRFIDYTTAADVTIHDREGTEVGRFPAGIAPAYIDFGTTEEP